IPTDKEIDIYTLALPIVKLRPASQVPFFQWARQMDVSIWNKLVKSYSSKSNLPEPPELHHNLWAPSGMENLEAPFKWAIKNSVAAKSDLWKFYYGAWLAGRSSTDEAIRILSETNLGLAKALLARLLKLKGDMEAAAKAFESIKDEWLQIHPQVIVERDKVLRNLGIKTLDEREKWLSKVDALEDEWIIERRVQLLIDKGQYMEAKNLLLSTRFQKVHQTYTRTGLWIQVCEKLNLAIQPIPPQLGEDQLANFGAYREFE
ncbi:MAG: hypothetical protein ACXWV2_07400, partial [Chitinophagaceae bacterium]